MSMASMSSVFLAIPIPAVHFSIPFQAIMIPLSVHSFGGGQTRVQPISAQIMLRYLRKQSLHATPPDTTQVIFKQYRLSPVIIQVTIEAAFVPTFLHLPESFVSCPRNAFRVVVVCRCGKIERVGNLRTSWQQTVALDLLPCLQKKHINFTWLSPDKSCLQLTVNDFFASYMFVDFFSQSGEAKGTFKTDRITFYRKARNLKVSQYQSLYLNIG